MEEKIKDQIKQAAKEKARIEAPSMQAFAKHYFEVGANFILPLIESTAIQFAEWCVEHSWERHSYGQWIRNPKNNPEYKETAELYHKFLSETKK